MKTEIIQVLASFVGSFGFAVLYNLRGRKLCMAGISGMVSWIAYLVAWNEMPSVFAANLAAAAVATVYAKQWHLSSLYGQKTILIAIAVAAGIMIASSIYGICALVWKDCKQEVK